jgi:UPF0176 protein
LLELLCALHPHHGQRAWRAAIDAGRLRWRGDILRDPTQPLRAGAELWHEVPDVVEPWVDTGVALLYEDAELLALHKPAPLPVHPCGRYRLHTITALAAQAWPELTLRPVHRLDAATTGVLLLAKTRAAARALALSFEQREVAKRYLALIEGHPADRRFCIERAIARTPGPAGSRGVGADDPTVDEDGDVSPPWPARLAPPARPSRSEVCVLARRGDGSSLVEITPHQGRTNQIRLHLASLGYPIVGDLAYRQAVSGGGLAEKAALTNGAICLHAWRLTVAHPQGAAPLTLEAPLPPWARDVRRPSSGRQQLG